MTALDGATRRCKACEGNVWHFDGDKYCQECEQYIRQMAADRRLDNRMTYFMHKGIEE